MEQGNVTQKTLDKLADILWWLRGYAAGIKNNGDEYTPFDSTHRMALSDAIIHLKEQLYGDQK